MNLLISITYNYSAVEKKLKIKLNLRKNLTKIIKQKKGGRDITAHLNKKVGHFLDEYERQNQEIRERLKEKLI